MMMLCLKIVTDDIKTEGFNEVYTSKNGNEAFDIYKGHKIDLYCRIFD